MEIELRTLPPAGIGPLLPGFYRMSAAEYHADPCPMPSLSSSVAKILIDKTPRHAAYAHPRLLPVAEPAEQTAAMRLGTATHELVLGKGGGIVVIEADSFASKDAKALKAKAIAMGLTPILLHEFDEADMIAEAVRIHLSECAETQHIFKPDQGIPEVVAIWQEGDGTWCRAMFDWWTSDLYEIDDLKVTAADISPTSLGRKISDMRYEVSEAFYRRGVTRLLPEVAGRLKFRFVFVERDFPHEVVVMENDGTGRAMGDRMVAWAIAKWSECLRNGEWPGYPRRIHTVEYPQFAETAWLTRELAEEGIA